MKKLLLSIIPLTLLIVVGCAGKTVKIEDIADMPLDQILIEAAEHIDPGIVTETPEHPVVEWPQPDDPVVVTFPEYPVVTERPQPEQPVIAETHEEPEKPIEVKFPRVGMWRVTGLGQQGNWTANMVIDQLTSAGFSGYFQWRGGYGNGGTEFFRGTYDPLTRKLAIQGYRLANARGIALDRYEAYLTSDGKNLESGTWSDGGKWEAKWEERT